MTVDATPTAPGRPHTSHLSSSIVMYLTSLKFSVRVAFGRRKIIFVDDRGRVREVVKYILSVLQLVRCDAGFSHHLGVLCVVWLNDQNAVLVAVFGVPRTCGTSACHEVVLRVLLAAHRAAKRLEAELEVPHSALVFAFDLDAPDGTFGEGSQEFRPEAADRVAINPWSCHELSLLQ